MANQIEWNKMTLIQIYSENQLQKSSSQWLDFITLFRPKNIYFCKVKCICHKAGNVERRLEKN